MRKNVIALAVLVTIFVGYAFINSDKQPLLPAPQIETDQQPERMIGRIGEGYFNFEIADEPAERVQGLSGRENLPETDSLLFIFDSADNHCFWMKDMKFAIDILWFDENKKLIYEKRNAMPESFPESFCSDKPAKYVAEVKSGVTENNQIKLGDYLDIEL